MPAAPYYTAEMVRAFPDDGNRYETVHGELLVTPAPRPLHELVLQRIMRRLAEYLTREPVGHLWGSRSDISWVPDVLVQPDCFVVPVDEARTLDWARMTTLMLAVEVLSPSTARADRFTKRRLYQEHGVRCYWLVDPDRQCAEVWTPGSRLPEVVTETLVWRPEGAREPCAVRVEELFEEL